MTIKTTETKEIEKEINLPYYYKLTYETLGDTHYALMNEEKSLRIDLNKEITALPTSAVVDGLNKPNYVESTREEFEKALNETVESIMKIAVS